MSSSPRPFGGVACCEGAAPRSYMDLGCPGYSRISSTFSPLTLNNIRTFTGVEAAREYVRRELRRNPDELWCGECESWDETFGGALAQNWEFIARGVAGLVAYVPVFGTAIAFVINTAVSLAKGERIDEALLDGVRGSLPGQPLSSAAFDAIRATAEGKPLDEIAIAGIAAALGETTAGQVRMVIAIVRDIAEGRPISDVVLDQVAEYLPPAGRVALHTARELAAGGSLEDAAVYVGGELVASGRDAFLASAAYQELLATLPPDLRDALNIGAGLGLARRLQDPPPPPPMALGREERPADRARNDELARRGFEIALGNSQVMALRSASSAPPQRVTTDSWRRGFDIGTATSAGHSLAGSGQDAILDSLPIIDRKNGFLAARAQQYRITLARSATKAATSHAWMTDLFKKAPPAAAVKPVVVQPVVAPIVASSAPPANGRASTAASLGIGAGLGTAALVVAWALWR